MKCVIVRAFGQPNAAARVEQAAPPGEPGPREVVIEMIATPINPADLLMIQGLYDRPPPLPLTPGSEGCARVTAVGEEVRGFTPGDLVVPLTGGGLWRGSHCLRPGALVRVPSAIDPLQASMLMANPATARLLLDWVGGRPAAGEWIVQNAANSAVGRMVEALAGLSGINVVNIVRSRAAARTVAEAGAAGPVLVAEGGSESLRDEVLAATGGARPILALDAIGGAQTGALAAAVADGGAVVTYGILSGEPARVDLHDLVFRDIRLRGFWLAQYFRSASRAEIGALYEELSEHMAAGRIKALVEAVYPVDDLSRALSHAAGGGRSGKVLLDWAS
jgi:mitochondrial enoyl-[acyl-carrier protein] reductase / trans-2-enoyl-CoA reductase